MPLLAPITTPNVINDPGYLLYAPLGTSLPTNTVTGSVFTDTWAAPWVQLGMTDSGSVMTSSLAVSEVDAAESLDPADWRRFDKLADEEDATAEQIMDVIKAAFEQVAERPTSLPSDSSDGQISTEPKSGSNSAVKDSVLSGRPDLQLAVMRAG
jgi:hypothetical protein